MLLKGRRRKQQRSRIEERYQQAVDLFKDLDKREFNRLLEGLKLAWEGYNKIRQVQSIDEKEMADITGAEKELDYIEMKD